MQNIHPYVIHFPIAIISIGLLWDLLGVIFKKESFKNAGWWAQLFGTAAIIIAAVTGLIAANTVEHSEAAHEIMETHQTLELIALGIFIILFLWRSYLKTQLPTKVLPLVIYLLVGTSAVILMLTGAHLGGRMVYEFGIGGSAVHQTESAGHHHHHESEISEPSDTTKHEMMEHESDVSDTSETHAEHHHHVDDQGTQHKH